MLAEFKDELDELKEMLVDKMDELKDKLISWMCWWISLIS